MLKCSIIIYFKLSLVIDSSTIQLLHTSIVTVSVGEFGIFSPHSCKIFKLFIADRLWVVNNKELCDFTAWWSSETSLIIVHLLNVKFLYKSIDLNVGRVCDHIIVQVFHLELLNEPVVLVAAHFPVKENAYHCMGIRLILVLTAMDHVQFQVKLMSSDCVL